MAFRPPINRSMRVLSRPFFKQEHMISAARIFVAQNIAKITKELQKSNDRLHEAAPIPNLKTIVDPPPPYNTNPLHKCILLRPGIIHDDRKSWSETVRRLVDSGDMDLIPYTLQLTYENWTWDEILMAILPEEVHGEIPSAFNHAGHLAQLNLRPPYLPYKSLIAQVILDKNPGIKTVINKTSTLDENEQGSVFRTLQYEVLAGEDNTNVEAKEEGNVFRFDYAKVFWNSKLSNEHRRLVSKFKPGEAVCDVMAGVGPFAIPAGKKGVFVWANDYNPESYKYLRAAARLNKVHYYVRSFCADGRDFIPGATRLLLSSNYAARISKQQSKSERKAVGRKAPRKAQDNYVQIQQPKIFSHYVMNLPSTASDFLPAFRGIYSGYEEVFTPYTAVELPMVHCYCFVFGWDNTAGADNEDIKQEALEVMSGKLGHQLKFGDKDLEIHSIRKVAPTKQQLCVSFRLPPQIAFAQDH